MALQRLDRDTETVGGLTVRVAPGDEVDHLPLPRGETLDRGSHGYVLVDVQQIGGHVRGYGPLARRGLLDQPRQLVARRRLRDVPVHPRLHQLDDVVA